LEDEDEVKVENELEDESELEDEAKLEDEVKVEDEEEDIWILIDWNCFNRRRQS